MADEVQEPGGLVASGNLEEISLDVVVFHADGTSTNYGTVSRTNFKEQSQAEALANVNQPENILKWISNKVKEIGNSNG